MKFMKLGSKPDSFRSDGNIRYVGSELAADFIINVGEVKFYLHKFPLISKCHRLQKLLSSSSNNVDEEEIEIHEIPGGYKAFETCAKFCYGVELTLNAYNAVSIRCAAEFLEMYENIEKGNLIYKVDVFLNSVLFRSWKDSITVLQTSKPFSLLADDLKLTAHCIEAIASKASADPTKVDWPYTYNHSRKLPEENAGSVLRARAVPGDWWVEDLCELDIALFRAVVSSIKNKKIVPAEVIGEALKAYAYRNLPGSGSNAVSQGDVPKLRSILETIVWLLPGERGCISCSFLLKLLKAVISVESGEAVRAELVRRIGRQLEEASANDLLIRACSDSGDDAMMYDVRIVERMLEEFRLQEGEDGREKVGEIQEIRRRTSILSEASKLMVAKLVDSYLSEIATDPNLPLASFAAIADMVSGLPRPSHDALYRAIDTYLKEHPGISKSERKRICRLMDCKKLSAEACMHAVQNERLPLRVVVQVLFFEQVRASASSGSTTPDLPGAIIKDLNCPSSRSTNNNDEDWDNVASVEELRALRGELAALRVGNNICNNYGEKIGNGGKMKGLIASKRVFSKTFFRSSGGRENSGSDSSGSLGSGNPDECLKSTPARKGRSSVS